VCAYACMYLCMYVLMYVRVYVCIYGCICMYVFYLYDMYERILSIYVCTYSIYRCMYVFYHMYLQKHLCAYASKQVLFVLLALPRPTQQMNVGHWRPCTSCSMFYVLRNSDSGVLDTIGGTQSGSTFGGPSDESQEQIGHTLLCGVGSNIEDTTACAWVPCDANLLMVGTSKNYLRCYDLRVKNEALSAGANVGQSSNAVSALLQPNTR
jgi:hypothetical protein